MNKTSDILEGLDFIKSRLETISTANGYNHSPNIKRGWLEFIFSNKNRHREPIAFPVIAYRPKTSAPQNATAGNESLIDVVTVHIDGAVSVKDSEDSVTDLLNLLKDVRRSLVFDPENQRLKISDLTIQDCPFDTPESGDDYAFFSQAISFRVTEQYA
ncbi:hypothetical protein [Marinobacterium lutimaris]|uniref:Uncharacterized protein n=1 Tax=Marinobacterium lutimaris TaxID=568106 RepID=A0A1H5XLQ5_9GAMM|nr:hypothetical protein [Marinobacterium lutimaris]SEG12307.1 hypothetical protein SAMN05444390_1011420 [Marinobacterium lutimaris]